MSSYGRAAPPHHNYELFSIVRLVGISNQLGAGDNDSKQDKQRGGRNSVSKGTGAIEDQRVTIQQVAAGGYVDHSFVAMALSNGITLTYAHNLPLIITIQHQFTHASSLYFPNHPPDFRIVVG